MAVLETKTKIDEVHEMIRFHVHLQIDVDREEMEDIGKPTDWNWDRMVDRGLDAGSAFTQVSVTAKQGETFTVEIDDNDELVNRKVINGSTDNQPTRLEKSFDDVLGFAQNYIADQVSKYGEDENWQKEQFEKLRDVREFARDKLLNPDIGDDSYDSLID